MVYFLYTFTCVRFIWKKFYQFINILIRFLLATIKKRIDDINLLRVIACFMVIILHGFILIQDILPSTLWAHLLYTPAWGGVWIFVILAGFLAGKSFNDGKYAISKKGFFLYYKRKFFRLAPSYYFLVFITTVLVNINFLLSILKHIYIS